MAITLFLSLPSKRVPISICLLPYVITPHSFQTWSFSPNSKIFLYHSQILLTWLIYIICLIYIISMFNFVNLYFHTIRSMTTFLKIINKVKFDLLLLAELLELLAINHSSFERRIISVLWLLDFSYVLVVYNLHGVCTSLQLSWVTRSALEPFPGCQHSCGIVPNGLICLVISFNVSHGLKS